MESGFLKVAFQNFLVYFVFYLLMTTIAPYANYILGTSTGISGLASGVFVVGILFGRLIAGGVSTISSPKKVLVCGSLFFALCSALYLWAKGPMFLIVLRFLHGLSFGIAHNACGTIAASLLPPEKRGEGIAYYTFGQITSNALGPFVGVRLVEKGDFQVMFLLSTVVSGVAFLLSLTVPGGYESPREEKRLGSALLRFFEPSAIAVSLVIMLAGLAFSGVLAFLSMYGVRFGLSQAVRYFFVVYAATVLATRPLSGRLLDLLGAKKVIPPCVLFFALGLFLLARAGSSMAVLFSGLLIGLGYGNILSLGQAEAVKGVKEDRIAVATATYFIFLDIGAGLGPYLFGSMVPQLGYRNLYAAMGLFTLVSLPLYLLFKGKGKR